MVTKYKVVGRKDKKKRALGIYDVPDEAVELVENLCAVSDAVAKLRTVNQWNITDGGGELGRQIKWVTIRALEMMIKVMRRRLATHFLAPDADALRRRREYMRR